MKILKRFSLNKIPDKIKSLIKNEKKLPIRILLVSLMAILIIFNLLAASFLNLSTILDSQVLYFNFNNNSCNGGKGICDLSGNFNYGEVNGAYFNPEGGIFEDGAFEFNGNSEISVKDSKKLSPSTTKGDFSVSFWLRPDSFNFTGGNDTAERNAIHFLSKYSTDGNNREWYFRIYNDTAYDNGPRGKRISFYVFSHDEGLGAGSYFQDDLKEGEWIHIAGVVNKTHIMIYKNGVLRDSSFLSDYNIKLKKGHADLKIGRYSQEYPSFNGSIDELRIFNKALAPSEVVALYNLRINPD
ncbi:MAG: LamG domain-containing protein [archaeon]|nr:LamG domain-containing protein [archaeon]